MSTVNTANSVYTEEQLSELYPGEWVCIEVVATTGLPRGKSGLVIAHSPEMDQLMADVQQFVRKHPRSERAVIYPGLVIERDDCTF